MSTDFGKSGQILPHVSPLTMTFPWLGLPGVCIGYQLRTCSHSCSIVMLDLFSTLYFSAKASQSHFMINWLKTKWRDVSFANILPHNHRHNKRLTMFSTQLMQIKVQFGPFTLWNTYMIIFFFLLSFSQILSWNVSAVFYFNSLHEIRKVFKQWTAEECCSVSYFCSKHLMKLHIFYICNADLHSWLLSSSWTQASAI